MLNGKSPREVVGHLESGVRAFTPASVAFIAMVAGGTVDRYRRLRKERDHGAVSIETAIIVAVLIAAAVAIALVIGTLWRKYRDDLEKSDDKYKEPNT